MAPRAPLIVAAALLIASAAAPARAAFTWAPCTPDGAAKAPLLTPRSVALSPDPPQIGGGVVFGIEGDVSSPVASGTIGLRVKFEGVDLYEEQGPLCDKVAGDGCPLGGGGGGGSSGGKGKIEYRQDLPPIAPPGHYSVRVIGTAGASTYDGEPVVCVDVDFDMVMPSSLSAAGAAADEARVAVV